MSRQKKRIAAGILLPLGFVVALLAGSAPSGAAGSPIFAPDDWDVTFDFVNVGTTSAAKTVTITNIGGSAMVISSIEVRGKNNGDFHVVSDSCTGHSVAPNANCQFGVTFTPSASGTRVAQLRFSDNTPCHNFIHLAGSGQQTQTAPSASASTCESGRVVTQTVTQTQTQTNTVTIPGQNTNTGGVEGVTVVGLPAKACKSRRVVVTRVFEPKGVDFKSVTFKLGGKTFKTRHKKGSRIWSTRISFKGLPRGKYTLRITARTTDGRTFHLRRHYITCVSPH